MSDIPYDFAQVKRFIELNPKWYKRRDALEQAVSCNEKEVFDYLVSREEIRNLKSVLKYTMEPSSDSLGWKSHCSEYFSLELIKKGASMDVVYSDGDSLLHRAVQFRCSELARVLLERGVNPDVQNSDGCTSLHLVLLRYQNCYEFVTTLLCYGADALVEDWKGYTPFEYSLVYCNDEVQEVLYYYTVDHYFRIHFDVLVKLALEQSQYFSDIVRHAQVVTPQGLVDDVTCLKFLLTMDHQNLKLLVKLYTPFLKEILLRCVGKFISMEYNLRLLPYIDLENFKILLESDIGTYFPEIISSFCYTFEHVVATSKDETSVTRTLLFLLSYGLELLEHDLLTIYENFGHCDLFKMLLHMNFRSEEHSRKTIPGLFYDTKISVAKYQLLDYFAGHYKVPFLVELARNAFRRFFISTFDIRTTRRFYTLLKHLPVSTVYKEIISYEKKLYVR